ncbi:unnamed protein product [Heligmosomoides polygyrus]|uniref:Secreted protein n=1 Tax=Heligmosomoides polygyrus TaxID=6339 RepID=A0A183FIE5_HELPZ|nr:unnamed protein product [Heligmosomoides polygyrus]
MGVRLRVVCCSVASALSVRPAVWWCVGAYFLPGVPFISALSARSRSTYAGARAHSFVDVFRWSDESKEWKRTGRRQEQVLRRQQR